MNRNEVLVLLGLSLVAGGLLWFLFSQGLHPSLLYPHYPLLPLYVRG